MTTRIRVKPAPNLTKQKQTQQKQQQPTVTTTRKKPTVPGKKGNTIEVNDKNHQPNANNALRKNRRGVEQQSESDETELDNGEEDEDEEEEESISRPEFYQRVGVRHFLLNSLPIYVTSGIGFRKRRPGCIDWLLVCFHSFFGVIIFSLAACFLAIWRCQYLCLDPDRQQSLPSPVNVDQFRQCKRQIAMPMPIEPCRLFLYIFGATLFSQLVVFFYRLGEAYACQSVTNSINPIEMDEQEMDEKQSKDKLEDDEEDDESSGRQSSGVGKPRWKRFLTEPLMQLLVYSQPACCIFAILYLECDVYAVHCYHMAITSDGNNLKSLQGLTKDEDISGNANGSDSPFQFPNPVWTSYIETIIGVLNFSPTLMLATIAFSGGSQGAKVVLAVFLQNIANVAEVVDSLDLLRDIDIAKDLILTKIILYFCLIKFCWLLLKQKQELEPGYYKSVTQLMANCFDPAGGGHRGGEGCLFKVKDLADCLFELFILEISFIAIRTYVAVTLGKMSAIGMLLLIKNILSALMLISSVGIRLKELIQWCRHQRRRR